MIENVEEEKSVNELPTVNKLTYSWDKLATHSQRKKHKRNENGFDFN